MNKKIYLYYFLYYLIVILSSIYSFFNRILEFYFVPIAFISCLFLPLLFKLFHLKMMKEFHILNLLFVLLSIVFGSILDFYSFHYYDKFLHFCSGLLFTEFAYIFYQYLIIKHHSKDITILCLIFVNSFNMMIAVFWEFFEYACLIFLNNDAIHHYSSGVHDTMTDMLVALCGGIVITFGVFRSYKTNKENLFTQLSGKFTHNNT